MEEKANFIEKELQAVKMAALYELRLLISNCEKKEYTRDEILNLLDQTALS